MAGTVGTKRSAVRRDRGSWRRLAWSPLLLALVVSALALPMRGSYVTPDGAQNLAGAANLLHEGTYSSFYTYQGRLDDPEGILEELVADDRREPLMSWVLLPFMATAPGDADRDCLIHAETPDCAAALRWTKLANVLLLAGFSVLAMSLARQVGVRQRWAFGFGALTTLNGAVLPLVDDPRNTLLLAVLMTALALLGLRALDPQESSRRDLVLLGAVVGLLALTRTITVAVVVLCAVALITATRADRSMLTRLGVVAVTAAVVVAPWIARNAAVVGQPRIANGSHLVLAVRAEATSFTAAEYATSFLAHIPETGEDLLDGAVDERHWTRWLRETPPDSFFELALGYVEGGEVQRRAGPQASEADVRAAAIDLALERWPKSVALTLPYTYRGLWVTPDTRVLRDRDDAYARGYTATVERATSLLNKLALPIVLFGFGRALRRRDAVLLAAVLPAVATIAVHGAFTHFIPRYSIPLMASFYLLLLVTLRPSVRTQERGPEDQSSRGRRPARAKSVS